MSHENGETPEHPESPLARPKPEGLREFSPRAILCGLFVAAVMGASYPYVVLKLGFGPNVSVVAAILGYIVLGLLFTRVASLLGFRYRPYNRWENNIIQTAGTAAAQTAFMCVLLAAFDMLTERKNVPFDVILEPHQSFAWLTAAGLLGVLLAVPLRRHYIVEEKLPFADGLAAGETLLLCDSEGSTASRAALAMLAGIAASALLMTLTEDAHVFNLFKPMLVVKTGLLARTLVGINWSLLAVGSGMLIGMRINVSMLLGALLAWVVAPFALREAGILRPDFKRDNVLFWVMWPATGMLVAGGLTALLLRWRVLRRAFQNLSSATTGGDEFPLRWVLIGVLLCGAALVVVQSTMLQQPAWITLVAILLSLPLALVGLRVLGETNWGPISALSNMMQGFFAFLAPGNVPANMVASGTTGTIAVSSEAIMQDYKLVDTNARLWYTPGVALARPEEPVMTESSTPAIAYSYIRFSSRQQAEGDSERRQSEKAEDYCRRKGWTLDASLTLRDLGVSAFRGDNALIGNLGVFLAAVRKGTVPAGSVLIVESFDRISRQGIDEGYDLCKGILKAGVRIVTLAPEREFGRDAVKSLSKGALEIQLILERAAEESETKSVRCAAAQANKRKRARENGHVMTRALPGWLEVRDGKIVPIPERVAVVKSIFALAASGYGYLRIVKKLEADGVPPFGKSRHWARATVVNMIRDRRVVGEMQPCRRAGKDKRVKDGEPIKDYYPAVVTEAEWFAAQASPVPRGQKRGRQTKHANIFPPGMLVDARDGGHYIPATRMDNGKPRRVLLPAKSMEGRGKCYSFSLPVFERAILSMLAEIDPHTILNGDRPPDQTAPLTAELKRVEAELAEAKGFMATRGFSPTIGEHINDLEARLVDVNAELTEERVKAAHPASENWGEAQGLIGVLDGAVDVQDCRLRLRAALAGIIDRIMVLIVPRGLQRLAAVQVWFSGGKRQRSYLISHKPAHVIRGQRTEEQWWARSFADLPAAGDFDLRRSRDVRQIERSLGVMDVEIFLDSGKFVLSGTHKPD